LELPQLQVVLGVYLDSQLPHSQVSSLRQPRTMPSEQSKLDLEASIFISNIINIIVLKKSIV
jgi:hypothetical protein